MESNPDRPTSEADRLVVEAATGARRLARDELQRIREHVARAGFHPASAARATGLAGIEWHGRALRGSDRLTPAEIHYLKHAVVGQEWPAQTTLEAYLASIRDVILDSRSGLFTSRYFGEWQLGIVGRSSAPESAGPPTFILVEYRLSIGHWVTAYRAEAGLRALDDPNREELRWLRRPR